MALELVSFVAGFANFEGIDHDFDPVQRVSAVDLKLCILKLRLNSRRRTIFSPSPKNPLLLSRIPDKIISGHVEVLRVIHF